MAKGAASKAIVTQKILEVFDGAFEYGKELRIPMEEDGVRVEIKVTLTCAKTNVGDDNGEVAGAHAPITAEQVMPPTEEEKKNIATLMERLGI